MKHTPLVAALFVLALSACGTKSDATAAAEGANTNHLGTGLKFDSFQALVVPATGSQARTDLSIRAVNFF